MKPSNVKRIFQILQSANPEPKTELYSTNPYTLLVAIVLSAQSTDAGVNKATPALFACADSPQKMLDLGENALKNLIKTIGLFNAKAKNIISLSQKLISDFNSAIPHTVEALQSLPGVGSKTANVWLNCVLGLPLIAVDTHVLRVSNRLGIASTSNPDNCQKQLEAVIPKEYKKHAHHWLILHGRYVCKARTPLCQQCSIIHYCEYMDKNA